MIDVRKRIRWGLLGAGLVIGAAVLAPPRAAAAAADDKAPADAPPKRDRPADRLPGGGDAPAGRPGAPGAGAAGARDPLAMVNRYEQAVMELDLTAEQKPKMQAAFDKAKKELEDLKAKGAAGENREAYGKAIGDLRETIGGMLTDAQKEKLRASLPAGAAAGPGGGAGPAGALRIMRQNIEKLDLTAEQKPKVEAAFKDAREKLEAAMKAGAGDRAAVREKALPVYQELQKTVADLLTAEQKTKWEEVRKEQQDRGPNRPGAGDRPPGAAAKEGGDKAKPEKADK